MGSHRSSGPSEGDPISFKEGCAVSAHLRSSKLHQTASYIWAGICLSGVLPGAFMGQINKPPLCPGAWSFLGSEIREKSRWKSPAGFRAEEPEWRNGFRSRPPGLTAPSPPPALPSQLGGRPRGSWVCEQPLVQPRLRRERGPSPRGFQQVASPGRWR